MIKTWNRQDKPLASREGKERKADRKHQEEEGWKETERISVTVYEELIYPQDTSLQYNTVIKLINTPKGNAMYN